MDYFEISVGQIPVTANSIFLSNNINAAVYSTDKDQHL
jgi:hypothetical protein